MTTDHVRGRSELEPADTKCEHPNTSHTSTTDDGSYSTYTANKLDPRSDSITDHRSATGATKVGDSYIFDSRDYLIFVYLTSPSGTILVCLLRC